MTTPEALLTARQVAHYLSCAEETVKRLVRRGILPASRVGRQLRFRQEDVSAYLAATATAPRPSREAVAAAGPPELLAILSTLQGELAERAEASEIAPALLGACSRALPLSHGLVWLCANPGAPFVVAAATGLLPSGLQEGTAFEASAILPLLDSAQGGDILREQSLDGLEGRFPQLAALLTPAGPWALIPLASGGRLLGGLLLSFVPAARLAPAARSFISMAAHYSSQALELARLATVEREAGEMITATVRQAAERAVDNARLFQQMETAARRAVEAHTLLDTFVTTAPVGVALLDPALRYLMINPALAKLNGLPIEAHLGRSVAEVLPLAAPVLEPLCRQVLTTGEVLVNVELSGELPSQPGVTQFWLENFYPVYAADGSPRGVGVIVTDITARKQAEAEREQLLARAQAARAAAEAAQGRERLLADVSQALAAAQPDPQAVLTQISQRITALLGDGCEVRLCSEDGAWLLSAGLFNRDPAALRLLEALEATPLPATAGLTGQVLQTGQPVIMPSVDQAALQAQVPAAYRDYLQRYPIQSLMIVPLRARHRVIGTLHVSRAIAGRPFSADDLQLLLELADRAALAIDNARLYTSLVQARATAEATAERIGRLQQLTAALTDALTPADVAQVTVTEGTAVLAAQGGMLVLATEDGIGLEAIAATGYDPTYATPWQRFLIAADLPASEAARTGQLILLSSSAELIARYPLLAGATAEQFQARAAIPLYAERHVLGVLLLSFSGVRHFSSEEQNMMLLVGRQCAQALERARLYAAEHTARTVAEQALALRETFLSVAAHELKTPLTSLLGQAQLLERRLQRAGLLVAPYAQSVATVIAQTNRLSTMILALLDVSRLEQGLLRLECAPVDLCALLRQVTAELAPTLVHHSLVVDLPADPISADGDGLRLEQVVQNLLSNAVKYSPEGGAIQVALTQAQAEACLSVSDHGIGIPASALDQIGARFYRAPNVNSMSISGMGIGLYVVHEIVALHGGRVVIRSTEGKGTTVEIYLPLQGAPASPGAA